MKQMFEIRIKKSLFSEWEKTSFGKLTYETACQLVKRLTNTGCFYSVAKFVTE